MADISYTRTTWADGSEGGTAIDSTKLNNIEQGIVDAVAAIGPNDTTEDGTLKAQIDQNASDIETLQDSVDDISETFIADEGVINSVRFSVSGNGNRNIYINFSDGHTESLFFNASTIGVYSSATGTSKTVRLS